MSRSSKHKLKGLTERGNQRLRLLFNDQSASQPGYTEDSLPAPLQTLGKAQSDISANSLGTFVLQNGLPDGLVNQVDESGDDVTRSGFALCDIKENDLCELEWKIGEASGGFWTATKCGNTPGPTGSNSCVCTLLQMLIDEGIITEEQAKPVQVACGCELPAGETVVCLNCEGGLAPAVVDVALTVAYENTFGNGFGIDFETLIDGTHTFEIIEGECGGTVIVDTGPVVTEDLGIAFGAPVGTPTQARLRLNFSQFQVLGAGVTFGAEIEVQLEYRALNVWIPWALAVSRTNETATPYPCQDGAVFTNPSHTPQFGDTIQITAASYVPQVAPAPVHKPVNLTRAVQFDTLAELKSAIVDQAYRWNDRLQVTADGTHNGYYEPLAYTGQLGPYTWHKVGP